MSGYGSMGFMGGLSQGINSGNKLVEAYYKGQENKDKAEVKSVMAEGLETAKASRQADIDVNTQVGGGASADGSMTVPTYNDAKGNSYANADEQKAAAEKNAPSVDDFYVKNVVPKIAETYLKQGNIEQAEKWKSWADDKNTKTGMKHWTKALQAGQMGDFKSYADNMVKAYNTPGYYDDGLEAEGYDLVKDKEGNTTGMTLNLKNKSTGEKFAQTINGQKDMVQMGIGLLDPANAFKTTQAAVQAAEAAQAKGAESDLKFKRDVYRDDRKGERQERAQTQRDESALDRLVTGKEMDAKNQAAGIKLRAQAGDMYKKGASPEEVRRMLHQKRLSGLSYARMKPEEQAKIIDQDVQTISGGKGGNPMSGGIALPTAEGAPAKGAPMIYDSQTGQMVPYKR